MYVRRSQKCPVEGRFSTNKQIYFHICLITGHDNTYLLTTLFVEQPWLQQIYMILLTLIFVFLLRLMTQIYW